MHVSHLFVAILVINSLGPELAAAQAPDGLDRISSPALTANYRDEHSISGSQRVSWFVNTTVGPKSLAAGIVSAGFGTAINNPEEYGTHWAGFGKRYGMRLTGVATSNVIEAGLGSLWGEDPRYFHSDRSRSIERLRHAAAMTFIVHRADGSQRLAFARYAGIVGNNFISNTWRVSSESSVSAALTRTALGFAGRFASNVFDEFWQDVHRKVLKRP